MGGRGNDPRIGVQQKIVQGARARKLPRQVQSRTRYDGRALVYTVNNEAEKLIPACTYGHGTNSAFSNGETPKLLLKMWRTFLGRETASIPKNVGRSPVANILTRTRLKYTEPKKLYYINFLFRCRECREFGIPHSNFRTFLKNRKNQLENGTKRARQILQTT